MSPNALHVFVMSRFREVLGEPELADCSSQWSLQPFPGANRINVLISGGHHLAVWLFDPHTPRDAVHRWPVVHPDQVEEIANRILERVRSATGGRTQSLLNTGLTFQQQQWDRGAIDLLHAVKYSFSLGLSERSSESTTARRQRMVRAAARAELHEVVNPNATTDYSGTHVDRRDRL